MKKALIGSLILGLTVASTAWAGFGLPKVNTGNSVVNSVANKGVDMGKNKALEKVINDKIAKYNCAFKDDATDTLTTCDLNKVISELNNWKSGLEATVANRVQINVQADAKNSDLSYKRGNYVRDQLYSKINWWDYNVTRLSSGSNNLGITVSVN